MSVVVLLHAFPLDHRMWESQVDALRAAGHTVICPDLPGFGGTRLLAGEPSLDSVAHAVVRELDEDGVERAVIAGLSLGGYVAMALLRVAPERIAALALCDTKATADTAEAVANRMRIAAAAESEPGTLGRLLRSALLPGLLAPGSPSTERVGSWLDSAPPAAVAWYQRAMAARPSSLPDLARFGGPALVLWGDVDAVSPESDQRTMLAALTRAQEAVIADAGHLSAVERPDSVNAVLLGWLAGLD